MHTPYVAYCFKPKTIEIYRTTRAILPSTVLPTRVKIRTLYQKRI